MKRAIIFLADGFEEMEAVGTIDMLRRAKIQVTIAGVGAQVLTSAQKLKIESEICITKANVSDYDAVICPGGMPGAANLRDSEHVIAIVKEAFANGKLVCAICAAPLVLDKAGVLKGKKFTMYPSMETMITGGGTYTGDVVTEDGNIITGRGPAAVFEFAFKIIEKMCGKEVLAEVKKNALFK